MTVLRLESVTSTNDHARALLHAGRLPQRAVIVAREQTDGRGTGDRCWRSPRDAGIYMTVVDAGADLPPPATTAYTRAAGVACVEAVRQVTGINLTIKPINDLFCGAGKVGGILTEGIFRDGRLTAVLVGIGINTRPANRSLPPSAPPALSLAELARNPSDKGIDHAALINAIAARCFAWHDVLARGGDAQVEAAWQACIQTVTSS